jgi:putative endonuclease
VSFFRKRLGQEGEDLAASFLRKKGYKLVERNYRCKTGEVDLIVLDRKVVVFVEVKTRSDHSFGSPFEAVEARKQRKMIQAAQYFLHERNLEQRNARFDVIGISWHGDCPVLEHIENAFEVST